MNNKRLFGAALTSKMIKEQGGIRAYDENRREEGRKEIYNKLSSQLNRIESKLDKQTETKSKKFERLIQFK